MTKLEEQLYELNKITAPVPAQLAHRAWTTGRRARRRQLRFTVGAAVIVVGVATGVLAAAHPALAEPADTTVAAAQHHESLGVATTVPSRRPRTTYAGSLTTNR